VRGPYGFVRHPQYLGWLVAALALIVRWPSIESVVLLGNIAALVTFVAYREEAGLECELGCVWRAYVRGRPAFTPGLSRVREALAARLKQPSDRKGRLYLASAEAASRERTRP